MNKRGQFYITTAIIIILIVSGMASLSTYITLKSEPKTIEEIGLTLKQESQGLVDYGIYNNQDISLLLDEFTSEEFGSYFHKITGGADAIIIYGNSTSLNKIEYKTKNAGSVVVSGIEKNIKENEISEIEKISPDDEIITINLSGTEYDFTIKDNQMFYFVIVKESDGEIYVQKNP